LTAIRAICPHSRSSERPNLHLSVSVAETEQDKLARLDEGVDADGDERIGTRGFASPIEPLLVGKLLQANLGHQIPFQPIPACSALALSVTPS